MKDRDFLAELLFGSAKPFIFSSNSTYNPFSSSDQNISSQSTQNRSIFDDDYDIELTKDGAYVSFDVPGFTRDNLEISIEDRVVIIKGERVVNKKGEVKKILHKYKVDSNFNESNIEATVSNGILTLFLPNYIAKPKKTITIN